MMRMYPREFPSVRALMPERGAERRIYERLARSGRESFVYREWRRGYGRIEVDFAVWIEGAGCFARQVLGAARRNLPGLGQQTASVPCGSPASIP